MPPGASCWNQTTAEARSASDRAKVRCMRIPRRQSPRAASFMSPQVPLGDFIEEYRWSSNIEPALGKLPARHLNSARVTEYVTKRRNAGASNAPINREIAMLKRAFKLAKIKG